jgi:pyruvate dehydrogenase E2 component (dihydrolipoamide acetyltransferase)
VTELGRTRIEPTPIRAAIGRRMSASKREAPHFYVATEIEMDALLDAIAAHNVGRDPDRRATVTAFLVRAVALVLTEHPEFNAVWDGEALFRVDAVNIGVAIALEDGLIAPALLDCGPRDVDDLAAGLRELVTRARAGRLRPAEISDATFTVSNLGMFAVTAFTAIITPPQVSILATAAAESRAVVRDGEIVVRRIMTATLSSDHRAVDGASAARFLVTLKKRLEEPVGWAVDRA